VTQPVQEHTQATPPKLAGVKGMNDILPDEGTQWEALEDRLRAWLDSYGYRSMRTLLW